MNSQSMLSRRKMALDRKVWLVMLLTMLLSLGLISYRLIDNKACIPFVISVRSLIDNNKNIHELGETLIFKTSSPEEKETTWQFSDTNDKETSVSANMRHKFMKEGIFTVSATVNGSCSNEITVNIKRSENPAVMVENSNIIPPKIYGNIAPVAGRPERYLSDIVGTAYEWKILDKSTFPAINEQYATFTFTKPGLYILQLTIDHDRKKRSQIEINVAEDLAAAKKAKLEKPSILIPLDIRPPKSEKQAEKQPEKQPDKPVETPKQAEAAPVEAPKRKIINIRNEIFQSKLEGVVTGQNDVHDFDSYLPDGGETKVLVNGERNYKTFKQLCDDIRGKKKIVIESVELIRAEDNQIQQIKVKYKKKGGLFGVLP